MNNSVFNNYGVEIELNNKEDFLKIKETLTRIGIVAKRTSSNKKGLVQTAHILHKKGKYAIVHFKELFKLDGRDIFYVKDEQGNKIQKKTEIVEDDLARRNTISFLLEDWGLLKIKSPEKYESNRAPISKIKVLSHSEKYDWDLISKHSLGKRKKANNNEE